MNCGNCGSSVFFLKLVSALFCYFWTGLNLVILINLGFRQNQKFLKISVGFIKFAKWYQSNKKPKWQDIQKSKSLKIKNCKNHNISKVAIFKCKKGFDLSTPCTVIIVLIETLLYCIFYLYVNCILTEHLAECERFKHFSKCKVPKSKIKRVPSSLFGLPFLYLPNVFIHEPDEFIHARVVNKLSKFKFTTQRLSDVVLIYSVGKGDFQILPTSGWNLLSVTLWCLHPGHCYSSTHLLYNFVHYIQYVMI